MAARTRVYIDASAEQLEAEIRKAERALERLGREGTENGRQAAKGMETATLATSKYARAAAGAATVTSRVGSAARTAAPYLGAGLALGLAKAVAEAREAEKALAQTEAVIKSTGGAANVTADDVANLANSISLKSGIDDEAIQSGENLLLTFKNIRNEAGKGNDIFSQSTQVITDMSVALGQDLKSSAIQVGKALNDPTVGLTALQRVGVTFTEQTKDQINTLVSQGKTLKAQKIILKELTSEFGGSAAAQADSFDKLKVSAENFAESVGGEVMPTLTDMSDELSKILSDKHMTGDQRVDALGNFFEEWAGKGIDALEDAAPEIAHTGAVIAKDMIGAFAHAWWDSDVLGKLFLGAGALRLFGGPGVFSKLGGTMWQRMIGGMGSSTVAGAAGGAGGVLGKFAAPGATPARPMFVAVVNGGMPGGDIPGGTGTKGGWWNTAKSWGKGAALGGARGGLEAAGVIVVLGAAAGTAAIGGAAGSAIEDSLAPDGAGGLTKAQKGVAKLRAEVKRLAEAGEEIPARMITKAGLNPKELKDAGYNVTGLRVNIKSLSKTLDDSGDGFSAFTKKLKSQFGSLEDAAASMSKGQRTALVNAADAARDAGSITDKQFDKIVKTFGTAKQKNREMWEDIAQVTGQSAGKVKKSTGSMATDFIQDIANIKGTTAVGLAAIADDTNKALRAFGVEELKWSTSPADHPGNLHNAKQRGGFVGFQGGGVAMVPGTGTGDSFHTVVPDGTFILNRNAVNEFFGLQRGGPVPVVLEPGELAFSPAAVAQMGGFLQWANDAAPRFASGGSVAMPGTGVQRSYPGVSGDTDFIPALGNALSRMAKGTGQSISVQSGFRTYAEQAALQGGPNPAAAPGTSHHEYGYAADITPGNSVFGGVAGKYGLTFPLLGIGEPWHIELANPNSPAAKAVAAVAAAAIKRQVVDGPDGKLKDLSQAALDKAWKGAKDYVNKKQPAGAGDGPVSFPKGGAVDVGSLPPALQKWNKRFPGATLQTDPGAWMGLTQMPFNVAAAIAEWAGMPGVTMAQVSKGEGSLRPGSMGDDDGDGSPDGYGWLAITRPYGEAYGVNKYGGYQGMLNPISNAIVAKGMYDARGLDPWYGQRYVTDTNAHYSGPLLGKQRGGFVGMKKGGYPKPTEGEFDPKPEDPPTGFGPALPGFPTGPVKPGKLTFEQQLTLLGIQLTNAEETTDTADDLAILLKQQSLIQAELDKTSAELADLHLTKDDKEKARKLAADATAAMRKKFMEDGKLSPKEQRQLERAEQTAMKDAGRDILTKRRDELLEGVSDLTGQLASTGDSIDSLNEDALENLAELTEAMSSLATAIQEQNRLLSQETTTQRTELIRALADLMDGEIGGRVDAYSNTAGYGQVVAA